MVTAFHDPATYAGEFVCIRCGSGWPCCADHRPDGTRYTHEETCTRYGESGELCADCEAIEFPEETAP